MRRLAVPGTPCREGAAAVGGAAAGGSEDGLARHGKGSEERAEEMAWVGRTGSQDKRGVKAKEKKGRERAGGEWLAGSVLLDRVARNKYGVVPWWWGKGVERLRAETRTRLPAPCPTPVRFARSLAAQLLVGSVTQLRCSWSMRRGPPNFLLHRVGLLRGAA
jgi:hypothetical protein